MFATVVLYVFAGAWFLLCLWSAYVLSIWTTGESPVHVRWSATVVLAIGLAVVSFFILSPLGAFTRGVVLPLFVLLAGGLTWYSRRRSSHPFQRLCRDFARLRGFWGLLPWFPHRFLLGAVAIVAGMRLLRGCVAPPLGWDALTYHLFNAGRWVQAGGRIIGPGPDAWGYYEFFPPVGDILWAWAMLMPRSDALLGPAGIMIWLGVLLAGYAVAKSLGATARSAALTGLAVAVTPAVFNFMTSAYVNNTVLALLLFGVLFIGRAAGTARSGEIILGTLALGLACGAQLSAGPFLAIGMVIAVFFSWRRVEGRPALKVLLLCLLGAMIALPPYLRVWLETGSPFFPYPLSFGGWTLLKGCDEIQWLSTHGLLSEGGAILGPLQVGAHMFFKPYQPGCEHLNFGPGILFLLALVPLGLWRAVGKRQSQPGAVFLVLLVAVTAAVYFLPEMRMMRTARWAPIVGRLLLPGLAGLILLSAPVRGRAAGLVRSGCVVAGLYFCLPRGWCETDVLGVLVLAGAVAGIALIMLCVRVQRQKDPDGQQITKKYGVILALGVLVLACVMAWLRVHCKYRIWSTTAGAQPAFDAHPLDQRYAASWPLWKYLDGEEVRRLAVCAGWDGIGHNWYLYPLLGSRLQNEVEYVPVTATGDLIDYRCEESLVAEAEFEAWLERLEQCRIDLVISLPPESIEDKWINEHPQIFQRVARGGSAGAYRVQRFNAPHPTLNPTSTPSPKSDVSR